MELEGSLQSIFTLFHVMKQQFSDLFISWKLFLVLLDELSKTNAQFDVFTHCVIMFGVSVIVIYSPLPP